MQKFSKVLNQFWVYDRLGFTKIVDFGQNIAKIPFHNYTNFRHSTPIYDNFLFRKCYFMKRRDFVTNNFIPNLFFSDFKLGSIHPNPCCFKWDYL